MPLLEAGFVQELGALERMIDEHAQDVHFLCGPLLGKSRTKQHDDFLNGFYMEEFDPNSKPFAAAQKRPQVSRDKIRAAVSRSASAENPSDLQEMTRTIDKSNSGFIHGASPHIMELYGGDPPHFHVSGMKGTPRIGEQIDTLAQYIHRGMNTVALAAAALGAEELFAGVRDFRRYFEREAAMEFKDPETAIKKAKTYNVDDV